VEESKDTGDGREASSSPVARSRGITRPRSAIVAALAIAGGVVAGGATAANAAPVETAPPAAVVKHFELRQMQSPLGLVIGTAEQLLGIS